MFVQKPRQRYWGRALQVVHHLKSYPGQGIFLVPPAPYLWLPTAMPIGLVALSPGAPLLVTLFFLVNPLFWEDQNPLFPTLLLKLNTALWPLRVASSNGSDNSYMIFMFLKPPLSHFIVIVKQQCNFYFFMSAPSILRSIVTLF